MAMSRDHSEASRIAVGAGQLLLSVRERLSAEGTQPARVAAEGDRRSHELIMRSLAESHPDDAVLSEEGRDDVQRLEQRRAWVVDPLDGTREFSEGRSDWAVHVALVADHEPVAGAVALPGEGIVFDTATPPELVPAKEVGPIRMVVSRTRPPELATVLARRLEAELVEMGSAGVKVMAVMRGQADVYVHAGGQYEWDSAAPVAVALAGGLHASRIDGSPLRYNQADVRLPDLLVCRPELSDPVLTLLSDLL